MANNDELDPPMSEEFLRLLPRVNDIQASIDREHQAAIERMERGCRHPRVWYKGSNKFVQVKSCRDCGAVLLKTSRVW